MWSTSRQLLGQLRSLALSQVMNPSPLTISTNRRLLKSSSGTNPATRCPWELDDELIGKALSSPLFTEEREEPANRRQACHSFEESLLPTQSFSVCHSRTERPVHQLSSLSSYSREKPSRDSENERTKILVERQKEKCLSDFRAEIQKTRVPSRL